MGLLLVQPGAVAVALLVLACRPLPRALASRLAENDERQVLAHEVASGTRSFSDGGGEPVPTCSSKCGAEEFVGRDFKIGIGAKILYTITKTQCLADCDRKPDKDPCGRGRQKVAKAVINNKVTKLCCSIQPCTWVPLKRAWEQKVDKDELLRYPLQDMTHRKSVKAGTCLCCRRKIKGWNNAVSQLCRDTYNLKMPWWSHVILGGTEHFKSACNKYCSMFPNYRTAKKALQMHSWEKPPPMAEDVVGRFLSFYREGDAARSWDIEDLSGGTYGLSTTEHTGEKLTGTLMPLGEFLVADVGPQDHPGTTRYSLQIHKPVDRPGNLFWQIKFPGEKEYSIPYAAFRMLRICTEEQKNAEPPGCHDSRHLCKAAKSAVRQTCPVTCGMCKLPCGPEQRQHRKRSGLLLTGRPASCEELRANAHCGDEEVKKVCPVSCQVCARVTSTTSAPESDANEAEDLDQEGDNTTADAGEGGDVGGDGFEEKDPLEQPPSEDDSNLDGAWVDERGGYLTVTGDKVQWEEGGREARIVANDGKVAMIADKEIRQGELSGQRIEWADGAAWTQKPDV